MKNLLPLLFLIAFSTIHAQELYFPPNGTDAWETMEPESLGYCQDSIEALYNFLEAEQSKSFLLLKDGKIVLEKYFGSFQQDSLWVWFSAGKSLRAVLVGIAQSEGFLDIQDPTSDYLGKGWTSLPEEKEDLITIWHQLTMTSGLNPLNFSCTDPSCLTYFRDAGTFWSYHNSPYNLLKEVLESATTQNINQLTRNWIINKIGMQSGFWLAAGDNTFFFSRARDMARFGLMVQNRGYWGETAILNDSAYYHQMINSSQSLNPSYGYLWWLNGKSSYTPPSQVTPVVGPFAPDAPEDVFLAAGSRGQYISISPAEGLLLIRQGLSADEDKAATDLHNEIWKRVTRLNCTLTSLPSVTPPSIQLFPNPTREQVQVTGIAPESAQLSLYDASGQLLRQIEGQNQLSLQGLPSGIYLIKVQDGQRHLTERLVKY